MLRKLGRFDSSGADHNSGGNNPGDNNPGDDDSALRFEISSDSRGLTERLPAFYRENPGLLAPVLAAAEALLESLRLSLAGEGERWERAVLLDPPLGLTRSGDGSRGRRAAGVGGGTHEDVESWLARRHRAAPAVWSGLEVVSHAAGGLEIRRSRARSAVVAWGEDAPPDLEGTGGVVDLPRDLLPVGVRVHAVVLAHLPEGRPRLGARHAGRIVALRGVAP